MSRAGLNAARTIGDKNPAKVRLFSVYVFGWGLWAGVGARGWAVGVGRLRLRCRGVGVWTLASARSKKTAIGSWANRFCNGRSLGTTVALSVSLSLSLPLYPSLSLSIPLSLSFSLSPSLSRRGT